MTGSHHIRERNENGIFEYRRRVPRAVAHLYETPFIRQSLGTRDKRTAVTKARELDTALEHLWRDMAAGRQTDDARARYDAAVAIAKIKGFGYRPIGTLTRADDVVGRVAAAYRHRDDPQVVDALLGTVDEPVPRLGELWGLYEKHAAGAFSGLSENQLRKHRVARERAVAYAVAHLGSDRELGKISRGDVLGFRDWWLRKIESEGLRADTANRCFTDIKGMLSVVDAALRTNFRDVWAGVRIKATNRTAGAVRPPYPAEFVRDRILAPGALDGLNLEARTVVYLMVETGLRPSEACNLRASDIHLDAEIPHIVVAEREDRRRKTRYSARTIPLVGCALWAMRQLPGGFERYADREDTLSNTVNKYLWEVGLRPTKAHVLYSLRHTFQDRILAAGAPDRLQADLMGHEFDRPVYGEGASLRQKLDLLERIAFPCPSLLSHLAARVGSHPH